MNIFVLNCGSSSQKFQLFDMPSEQCYFKGVLEIQAQQKYLFKATWKDGHKVERQLEGMDKKKALVEVINTVKNAGQKIDVVAHRLVHGGTRFTGCIFIDEATIGKMEEDIELAPLHYPANIQGIKITMEIVADALQVGVFDTAFHATMPPEAYLYPLPYELHEKYSTRRYGFHGSSHKYVATRACEVLKKDFNQQKIVSCHLGSGASVAAIKNGGSVDTSMGMTPVEGLMMGTRTGDIDPGILLHIMDKEGLATTGLRELINKKSGLLGISGISSDHRDVTEAAQQGNERAQLALKMFNYRIKKYIGAYVAILGGLDILIFTGGIGENDEATRREICEDMECFGVSIDPSANKKACGIESIVSTSGYPVTVMVVPTNEELSIARESFQLTKDKLIR